jgi:methyl-accepting chemotaxis protein
MTPEQIKIVQTTFEALAPQGEAIIEQFYSTLFAENPGVREMFPDDMTEQNKHLLGAVALVAKNAHKLDTLIPALKEMGARHVGYGAQEAHYPIVRDTMLVALGNVAGDAWTPDVKGAWEAALNAVAGAMIEGAQEFTAKQAA